MQNSGTLIVLVLALVAPPGFANEETAAVDELPDFEGGQGHPGRLRRGADL